MSRKALFTIVPLALATALALPAHAAPPKENRGVGSVHQPVVSYAAYTYDVRSAADGGLTGAEAQLLEDWLVSIGLGYGDQVAIVTDAGYFSPSLQEGVANVVARHGLLIGEDSSAAAGAAPQGSVRVIVRRASASVPGCPNWRTTAETNMSLPTSSNFGCGVNGNWAAMVANPEDLVRGQSGDSDLRTATSNRAITIYREKAPTGAGDLKQLQAEGN